MRITNLSKRPPARHVRVSDTGGHYESQDVEGVLQEVGEIVGGNVEGIKQNTTQIVAHDESLKSMVRSGDSIEDTDIGIVSLTKQAMSTYAKNFELKGLTATNSVTNGDFSDGTTGWVAGVGSDITTLNNILTITADGTYLEPAVYQNIYLDINKTYFIKYKARVTTLDCLSMRARSNIEGSWINYSVINNPVQNQWYDIYFIITPISSDKLLFQHVYADAATANGKVMEINGNAGVFAIKMTGTSFEDYTEDEMLALVRSGYFEGTQSVGGDVCLKGVGKNLFSQNDLRATANIVKTIINDTTFKLQMIGYDVNDEAIAIKVKMNTQYTFSGSVVEGPNNEAGASYRFQIKYTDGTTDNMFSTSSSITPFSFTSDAGKTIDKIVHMASNINGEIILYNFQIEENTIVTPYEPYKEEKLLYTAPESCSVPAIADRTYLHDGKVMFEQNIYKIPLVLTGSEAWESFSNNFNVYRMQVPNLTTNNKVNLSSISFSDGILLNADSTKFATADFTLHLNGGINQIAIAIQYTFVDAHSGKEAGLSNIADFKAYLSDHNITLLQYQLATPITTELPSQGALITQPAGTVYRLPYTYGYADYGTGVSLPDIVDMIELYKYSDDNKYLIPIDLADVTVTAGVGYTVDGISADDFLYHIYSVETAHPEGKLTVESWNDQNVIEDETTEEIFKTKMAIDNGEMKIILTDEAGAKSEYELGERGDIEAIETYIAPRINSIWIPAEGLKGQGLKPATWISQGIGGAWSFSDEGVADNQQQVSGRIRIPFRMDRSIAPTICIGWSADGVSPGDVEWQFEYAWESADEDTASIAQETLTIVDTASATSNGLVDTSLSGVDIPSDTDICGVFRLTRLSAGGNDTIADSVELIGMEMRFTANKLGEEIIA